MTVQCIWEPEENTLGPERGRGVPKQPQLMIVQILVTGLEQVNLAKQAKFSCSAFLKTV